jgi:hypothetical protein
MGIYPLPYLMAWVFYSLFLRLCLCVWLAGWLAPPPGWMDVHSSMQQSTYRGQREYHVDLPTLLVNRIIGCLRAQFSSRFQQRRTSRDAGKKSARRQGRGGLGQSRTVRTTAYVVDWFGSKSLSAQTWSRPRYSAVRKDRVRAGQQLERNTARLPAHQMCCAPCSIDPSPIRPGPGYVGETLSLVVSRLCVNWDFPAVCDADDPTVCCCVAWPMLPRTDPRRHAWEHHLLYFLRYFFTPRSSR